MQDGIEATEEQLEIKRLVKETDGHLVINALAGTGKTTTLEMVQGVSSRQPILYLAFNKRVADEAKEKFATTTAVRTINSVGHTTWAKTRPNKLSLNGKKTQDLLKQMIDEAPKDVRNVIWGSFWNVCEAVGKAKAYGYIPEGKYPQVKRLCTQEEFHARLDERPDELETELIDTLLHLSIKTAYEGYIDFDDQVYMPTLFGGAFPRFPLVMGDEAQDFSPINHAMLSKLVTNRLIAVGDPWQSIYGFRGAERRGMEKLTQKFKAQVCDLSVSFRCPQAIVEAVRWRVPHFKWVKPGGHVEVLNRLKVEDIPDDAAILCRNNAPLFRLGMYLLQKGRSVQIAGSDMGPKIIGIMRKLGDERMPRTDLLSTIEEWRQEKLQKSSKSANDIADCMRVFASLGNSLGQALIYAEHLFQQKGTLQLSTGHKAKGLEWDTVFHLDPGLCRDDEQDLNLRYVISTRAKETLFEVDSEVIQ